MATKRTKSRRRRLKRGGYSRKEYELIGQSALEDEIDELEIGQYALIIFALLSFIGIIVGLANNNMELVILSLLFFVLFIVSYFLTNRQLNRVKSSKHTKSRIYRAGIDKVEKDKRELEEAKKYKANYVDRSGRAFTLSRRKVKNFKKKPRKSRK
tara:strand:- start:298 stop:762 length:465 start_codon:yes stop_codon:yes gene_type:complete